MKTEKTICLLSILVVMAACGQSAAAPAATSTDIPNTPTLPTPEPTALPTAQPTLQPTVAPIVEPEAIATIVVDESLLEIISWSGGGGAGTPRATCEYWQFKIGLDDTSNPDHIPLDRIDDKVLGWDAGYFVPEGALIEFQDRPWDSYREDAVEFLPNSVYSFPHICVHEELGNANLVAISPVGQEIPAEIIEQRMFAQYEYWSWDEGYENPQFGVAGTLPKESLFQPGVWSLVEKNSGYTIQIAIPEQTGPAALGSRSGLALTGFQPLESIVILGLNDSSLGSRTTFLAYAQVDEQGDLVLTDSAVEDTNIIVLGDQHSLVINHGQGNYFESHYPGGPTDFFDALNILMWVDGFAEELKDLPPGTLIAGPEIDPAPVLAAFLAMRPENDLSGNVYQLIYTFRDIDADAVLVDWEVVSAPEQIRIEDEDIFALPGEQRNLVEGHIEWDCEGESYTVELQLTIVDAAGHRSESQTTAFECNPSE